MTKIQIKVEFFYEFILFNFSNRNLTTVSGIGIGIGIECAGIVPSLFRIASNMASSIQEFFNFYLNYSVHENILDFARHLEFLNGRSREFNCSF